MKSVIFLLITIIIVFVILLAAQRSLNVPDNAILIVKPYWCDGTWVFDDKRVNLYKEPFVAGVPEMINHITEDIPNAKDGFRLLFSANPFPGYQMRLTWLREESGGSWYYSEDLKTEGWLCPALFKYYNKAPKEIYAKAEAINE